jgi:hypothetical protein
MLQLPVMVVRNNKNLPNACTAVFDENDRSHPTLQTN